MTSKDLKTFSVPLGAYDGIETFKTGERWKPFPPGSGKRSMELPAANTVIVFPDK